jgi:hypothetical protein
VSGWSATRNTTLYAIPHKHTHTHTNLATSSRVCLNGSFSFQISKLCARLHFSNTKKYNYKSELTMVCCVGKDESLSCPSDWILRRLLKHLARGRSTIISLSRKPGTAVILQTLLVLLLLFPLCLQFSLLVNLTLSYILHNV